MTGIASAWRRRKHRYNLYSTKCESCGILYFPPRIICPNCRRKGKMEDFKLSGLGEIVSFTIVHAPPEGYVLQVPYVLAIVKMDEGPMLTTQIVDTDPDKVKIGMRVKSVFRRLVEQDAHKLIHYGYKFRLIE